MATAMATLQWGHADVGVEDGEIDELWKVITRLQWGHADVGVEDVIQGIGQVEAVGASMGPRRCRRGRRAGGGSAGRGTAGLQWGHADVGVEDVSGSWLAFLCGSPSMGPRRCRRGRPRGRQVAAGTAQPSMGPRRCRRGRRRTDRGEWPAPGGPSMGPRRCRRGRRRRGQRVGRGPAAFNGATPMSAWKTSAIGLMKGWRADLQWGHADVGVEDSGWSVAPVPVVVPFNGATPMSAWKTWFFGPHFPQRIVLQWGHADVGVEDEIFTRCHEADPRAFNGATPMSAWKTLRGLADVLGHLDPSMGPRRCRRGRPQPRRLRVHRAIPLQWGHADVGVEDFAQLRRRGRVWIPSMGPRRCRRGRRRFAAPLGLPALLPSMGPRRCRRGRRRAWAAWYRRATGLQWGHADVGVEDDGAEHLLQLPRGPSMGPRRCRRGRRPSSNRGPSVRNPFNGATPMSAWKTSARISRSARASSLQWGHADVGVEDPIAEDPPRGDGEPSMGPRRCRRGRRRPAGLARLRGHHPSMGPRRCRRGRRRGRRPSSSRAPGPSSATPMSAWKTAWKTVDRMTAFNWAGDTPMSAWKTAWKTREPERLPARAAEHADVGVEDGVEDHILRTSSSASRPHTPMSAWKTAWKTLRCRTDSRPERARRCRRGRRRGRHGETEAAQAIR